MIYENRRLGIRAVLSVTVAGLFFIIIAAVPMPWNNGVSYITNPTLDQSIRQIIWLISSIVTFVWLYKNSRPGDNNFAGSLVASLYGPISILSLLLMRLSLKVFPMKGKSDGS